MDEFLPYWLDENIVYLFIMLAMFSSTIAFLCYRLVIFKKIRKSLFNLIDKPVTNYFKAKANKRVQRFREINPNFKEI